MFDQAVQRHVQQKAGIGGVESRTVGETIVVSPSSFTISFTVGVWCVQCCQVTSPAVGLFTQVLHSKFHSFQHTCMTCSPANGQRISANVLVSNNGHIKRGIHYYYSDSSSHLTAVERIFSIGVC